MIPNWRLEWPHLTVIVLMFALAAIVWPRLPSHIPADAFALSGMSFSPEPTFSLKLPIGSDISAPNNSATAYKLPLPGLLILPIGAVFVELIFLLIPWFDPGRPNYDQFAGAYATLRFAFVAYLAALYAMGLLQIFGYHVNRPATITILDALVFITIGNLLGKVRPNWFVGIHNPWTLSSKLAWDRTHRIGGWLFVAMGAVFAVSLVFPVGLGTAAATGVAGLIAIGLTIYSFFIWRSDPDKIPPAGTLPG